MRKFLALALTICFVLAFTACAFSETKISDKPIFGTETTTAKDTSAESETTAPTQPISQTAEPESTAASVDASQLIDNEPVDLTLILDKEVFRDYTNQLVSLKGGLVMEQYDSEGEERMFFYEKDGSGSEGSNLFFVAMFEGEEYTFMVDTEICDKDSEVYRTVQNFRSGDLVDLEGIIFPEDSSVPHVTKVEVK